jgi:hypothetical protein
VRSLFSRSKAVRLESYQECDDAGFGRARQESLRSSGYVSTLCHPSVATPRYNTVNPYKAVVLTTNVIKTMRSEESPDKHDRIVDISL